MLDEIPFNINSHIPPGQLRSTPDDPSDMARAVDWIRERAASVDDAMERAKLLSYGGVCAGILGDWAAGREMLDTAVSIAGVEGDARSQAVFRIRLADVIAGAGQPEAAVNLLREVISRCSTDEQLSPLLDFAHQHLGKALLEAGEIETGIEHLELARGIRLEKGNPELIASTEQALEVGRQMLR